MSINIIQSILQNEKNNEINKEQLKIIEEQLYDEQDKLVNKKNIKIQDIRENLLLNLSKKKLKYNDKKLILNDTINEYWKKEQKYKFPEELIVFNVDLNNLLNDMRDISENIKKRDENCYEIIRKKNKNLNLIQVNEEKLFLFRKNFSKIKIQRAINNFLLTHQFNIYRNRKETDIKFNKIELVQHYKILDLEKNDFMKRYDSEYNILNNDLNEINTNMEQIKDSNIEIDILTLDNLEIHKNIIKDKINFLKNKLNTFYSLLKTKRNNLKKKYIIFNTNFKNKINKKEKKLYINIFKYNIKIVNIEFEINLMENENSYLNNETIDLHYKLIDLHKDLPKYRNTYYDLKNKVIQIKTKKKILEDKISKIYKNYMNYYDYEIKDQKYKVLKLKKEIDNISSQIETRVYENEYYEEDGKIELIDSCLKKVYNLLDNK
jgi:hypothetical protein